MSTLIRKVGIWLTLFCVVAVSLYLGAYEGARSIAPALGATEPLAGNGGAVPVDGMTLCFPISGGQYQVCNPYTGVLNFGQSGTAFKLNAGANVVANLNTTTTTFNDSATGGNDGYTFAAVASGAGFTALVQGANALEFDASAGATIESDSATNPLTISSLDAAAIGNGVSITANSLPTPSAAALTGGAVKITVPEPTNTSTPSPNVIEFAGNGTNGGPYIFQATSAASRDVFYFQTTTAGTCTAGRALIKFLNGTQNEGILQCNGTLALNGDLTTPTTLGNILLGGTSNATGEIATGGAAKVAGAPGIGAIVDGGHIDESAACAGSSPNFTGMVNACSGAMTSGAATFAFANAYASAPVCVANDATSVLAAQVTTSTTAVTVTVTGGTTNVVDVACFGNPN